jgi:predicted nucleic acid-binding protein
LAELLILDAEPLSALAHARASSKATQRARAILAVAAENRALLRVPVAVLAEVCRDKSRDAAVMRVLNLRGIGVVDLNAQIARRAGHLLARHRLASAHAVDAFVVATTMVLGGGIIATHDVDDLQRLATGEPGIRIWPV